MDIITSELVVNFDRNRWSTSIGMGGQDGPEYALVRSFLFAGARAVVASTWPADDRSTAGLMTLFYSYLARGMDKGSALRQAKLDFIEKYEDRALPIHWAGMIMIGDGSDAILDQHQN